MDSTTNSLKDNDTQTSSSSSSTTTTTKRKYEHQVIVSDGDAKKKKVEVSSSPLNRTTTILNPIDYESWTREQVIAVLCTTGQKGGANLFEEDVKPLYEAGFNGTYLYNIVQDIEKKDTYFASSQLKIALKDSGLQMSIQLSSTCQTVVNWVDDLLETKLYHLWSNDHSKEWLCKSIYSGGADLTIEQFNTVKITTDSRTIDSDDIECMDKISKWLGTISLEIETSSLTDLLNGMTKLDMQQPHPYRFLNYKIQYVQRKDAWNSYLGYITQYINNSDPKAGDASVIFLSSASHGIGKSRFAFELPRNLEYHFQNEIPNIKMINLAIWFSSGSNFDSSELDSSKKPFNLERSIIARMIYSYIVHIRPHSWYGKYPSCEKFIHLNLLLDIYKDLGKINTNMNNWLLEFLNWIVSKEQENGKNLWIHFTMDDYNQLIQYLKDSSTKFDEWLEKLSTVQYSLDGKCIFTNLLAGTHVQSQTFEEKVKRIELSHFNMEEQEEIYNKGKFPLRVAKKTLFYSLGGHARLIDLFGYQKDCETSTILKYLEESLGGDFGSIGIGEGLERSTLEILIALCISQYPIRDDMIINGKTLKQLQRSMILFLNHANTPTEKVVYIPLLVLLRLIGKLVCYDPHHFMNVFKYYNITDLITLGSKFEPFKDFNHLFLVTKLNCLKLLETKKIIPSIRLDNIFPGADRIGISTSPENSLFQKKELSHHYTIEYKEKPSLVSLLSNHVVYKNGKGASFGDLFVILKSSSTKVNIICDIRVRHTELVTSNSSQNTKFLNNTDVLEELNKVGSNTGTLKEFWGDDMNIISIFITNRPIGTDIERSCCIGRNSNLEEYFGPFSLIVSYLGPKVEIV